MLAASNGVASRITKSIGSRSNEDDDAATRAFGVDIVGFGPIGQALARRILESGGKFSVTSISDSSITIYPKNKTETLNAIEWKSKRRENKLADLSRESMKSRPAGDTLQGILFSGALCVVDVTNSDYAKSEESRQRAMSSIAAGKNYVTANKVALANHFGEIHDQARRKGIEIGFGATICGARHAIAVAESLPAGEIRSASAVLNASTTFVLSKLEMDSSLTFEEACKQAASEGILESDWNIDLDGIDAAAKTAILSNVLFPKHKLTLKQVHRRGIREEEERKNLIVAASGSAYSTDFVVRLVSEIREGHASVGQKIVKKDSPLAVYGRFNAVAFNTSSLGEISVRSLGGGVDLTVSVIVADLQRIARGTSD